MGNKTVFITGCSSGFGRLAAKTFQREGWNVAATMRSPEKAEDLNELERVRVLRVDVTDVESIRQAVDETISTFGSIDVVVNNAGYGGHAIFEQASDETVRAMYDTNVFGVMNVCRAVLPHMRARKEGCIINVTSMAGVLTAPTISVYASSKHAVEGLTQGMAYEYAALGIKVKSVLPGAYPTTRFNANVADDHQSGDAELGEHGKTLFQHLQVVAEQMAQQGGESDPQEVADKIFECATGDTPVHNPVGADAEMLTQMMESQSRQAFIDAMSKTLLPQKI